MTHDDSPRMWVLLLVVFLATDLLYIGLHGIHAFTRFLPDMYFNVTYDQGVAEAFQVAKAYWIALLLAWMAWRRFSFAYLSWSAVFAYIAADDLLMVHEKMGQRIAEALGYPAKFGLRHVDFGEITVFALAGAVLLPLLVVAYIWGGAYFRRFTRRLFALLMVFAFFAGVVDMIHIMITHPTANELVGIIEDGGELLVMTAMVGYVLRETLAPKREVEAAALLGETR